MATTITTPLPSGWTQMVSMPSFNNTRVGVPGRWQIVANDDYAVWQVKASYVRSDFETATGLRIDDLLSFFLATNAANAFLVDVVDDNTDATRNGSGQVLLLNSNYRLFKRYTYSGHTYDHPITRPNGAIALAGGASGGTVASATGIVTGISAVGTWTGAFYKPMIFVDNGLSFTRNNEGIQTVEISLEENLEL